MESADASVLTFRVGDRRLAVPASEVAEVVRRPRLTRIPHAPESLAGVTSLRGEVLPVVSLARLIGIEAAISDSARVIVLDRDDPVGLAVDEVTGLARGAAQPGRLMMTQAGESRVLDLAALLETEFAPGATVARRRTAAPEAAPGAAPGAPMTGERVQDLAFLGFALAGQAYALPLEQVREVIAVPQGLASLPRTDEAMLGVVSHRDDLLPIVSTRALLGLSAAPLGEAARIVVAAIGDARVGLAVDRLTAILRAPASAIGPVPRVLNRAAGEAQIDAMLRPAAGGLVSVLAPERLFRDDSVAQILEDGRRRTKIMTTDEERGGAERVLIFSLAGETYGLPVSAVEEVVRQPETLTRAPKAPAFVAGVMNLRGEPVPVVDQRRRFGVAESERPERPRVIVTRLGDLTAGFAVDAVEEIAEIGEAESRPTPGLAAEAGRLFDRVATLADGRMILLVNPQELLDRAERDLLAHVARGAAPTT